MPFEPLYFLVFGTLSELLGIFAWLRVKSKASLIAGVASGLLLTVAGVLGLLNMHRSSLWLGGFVCLALLGRFLPGFVRKKSLYPDGLMAALALFGVILAVLGLR